MSRPTLSNLRGLQNMQFVFRWDLSFDNLPNALTTAFNSEDLNFRCESIEVPKMTNEIADLEIRGQKLRLNGKSAPAGSLTLTFAESINPIVRSFISEWREATYNTNSNNAPGTQSSDSDLRAKFTIKQLDNANNTVYQYQIQDGIYEDADFGTLDNTNDVQKPTLTIGYSQFKEGVTIA